MFEAMLTEDQRALRDQVRAFVRSVPRQLILDMDADRVRYPRDFVREAGRRNLLGMRFPSEYGGRGLKWEDEIVAIEEVGVLGTAVALSLIREMGPALTAIMITARAGSAMTAEIGIQRISEQIDALSTMRIDPVGYLISPRIAAAIISFPILTTFFDLIGILGGWISGCVLLGVNSGAYFYRVVSATQMEDITGGLVKSLVFGILVVTICCFQGYFTHMRTDSYGARSVSLSTTSAVVFSCVMILISDYVVTTFIL